MTSTIKASHTLLKLKIEQIGRYLIPTFYLVMRLPELATNVCTLLTKFKSIFNFLLAYILSNQVINEVGKLQTHLEYERRLFTK